MVSRRLIRLGILLPLAALAALGLALFALRNPPAPEERLESARLAIASAAEAGAPRYAPEMYHAADAAYEAGWLELARQRGRLRVLRSYRLADSLLEVAAGTAQAATSAAVDSLDRVKTEAAAGLAKFNKRLEDSRKSLDSLLTNHRAEEHWSMAHSSLMVSEYFTEMGAYEDALDALDDAAVAADRLDAVLADYWTDEGQRIALWRRWVEETLAESERKAAGAVIVDKTAHSLYVVKRGKLVAAFSCELGRNPAFQKKHAGDGATPEGRYRITVVKKRGSKYYKAVLLDYPNSYDLERHAKNRAEGTIPRGAGPGAYIEIHGMGGKGLDWTDGCVALTNEDMDAVLKHAGVGTPVTIVRKSDRWP